MYRLTERCPYFYTSFPRKLQKIKITGKIQQACFWLEPPAAQSQGVIKGGVARKQRPLA